MIRRLRLKFSLLLTGSLLALFAVIVTSMNVINYHAVVREADQTLALLVGNEGRFPDPTADKGGRPPHDMPPELPYESRYFSVLLDGDGGVLRTDTSRISAIDDASAVEYARTVLRDGGERGFEGQYRYTRAEQDGGVLLVFLDCGRSLDAFRQFLYTSLAVALTGFAVVSLLFCFFSGRILRPIAESYEKQKRFITDAGHEIKTPLTIIQANADILEMELGENESLHDIRQQTRRLSELTGDLILLSRMEEAESALPLIEFPVSEAIEDAAAPFQTLAKQQGKRFLCSIQPMLTLRGDDKSIRRLVLLLLDNALKYTPTDGTIALRFAAQGRSLCLTVTNPTETALTPSELTRVFDRFYRIDPSRSSDTGGHGIGLSVAKAIVTAHGGRIQADTQTGCDFRVTAIFPL